MKETKLAFKLIGAYQGGDRADRQLCWWYSRDSWGLLGISSQTHAKY